MGGYFLRYSMGKKTAIAAAVLALVCIGGAVAFAAMKNGTAPCPQAEIYVDGELYTTLPLNENCQLTITTRYGYNVVTVADGYISVAESDCPDKVCVHSGAINSGVVPIICLPHRLEIRAVSSDNADIDIVVQ